MIKHKVKIQQVTVRYYDTFNRQFWQTKCTVPNCEYEIYPKYWKNAILSANVHYVRMMDCHCEGISHLNSCPEWVLPL